jgi:hypothetical protein
MVMGGPEYVRPEQMTGKEFCQVCRKAALAEEKANG